MVNRPQMFVGLGTTDGQIMSDDSADALATIQAGSTGGRVALVDITVSSSQAVTSSGAANGTTLINPGARGIMMHLDLSSRSSSAGQSPTLDIVVQGQDAVTTGWFNLPGAAFTQLTTATSQEVLVIHPSVPNDSGTGFRRRPGPLPRTFRLQWTAQNLDSAGGAPGTYEFTVGGTYIP